MVSLNNDKFTQHMCAFLCSVFWYYCTVKGTVGAQGIAQWQPWRHPCPPQNWITVHCFQPVSRKPQTHKMDKSEGRTLKTNLPDCSALHLSRFSMNIPLAKSPRVVGSLLLGNRETVLHGVLFRCYTAKAHRGVQGWSRQPSSVCMLEWNYPREEGRLNMPHMLLHWFNFIVSLLSRTLPAWGITFFFFFFTGTAQRQRHTGRQFGCRYV